MKLTFADAKLLIAAVILTCIAAPALAVDAKMGNESKDAAPSDGDLRLPDQIGLESTYQQCWFGSRDGTTFSANNEYLRCFAEYFNDPSLSVDYAASYSPQQTPYLRIFEVQGSVLVEPSGLCYLETSRELEYTEISFGDPTYRYGKIRKFTVDPSGIPNSPGSPAHIKLNVNGVEGAVIGTSHKTKEQLNQALVTAAEDVVGPGTVIGLDSSYDFLIIPGVESLALIVTDDAYPRSEIAVEPTSTDDTYCVYSAE